MATGKDEPRKIIGGDGLVDGETTHGEDIKGNSTYDQDTAGVVESNEASQDLAADQRVADEKKTKEAQEAAATDTEVTQGSDEMDAQAPAADATTTTDQATTEPTVPASN